MKYVRKLLEIDELHARGICGDGVGVAILDTGISIHEDFSKLNRRIVCFKDFVNKKVNPYDDNGHGTHVAGICAGDGYVLGGLYKGIAPKCNIISAKVLDEYGMGKVGHVEEAILWVVDNKKRYGIDIINLSVGSYGADISDVKRLNELVEYAWDNGIVLLTAAGNKGPKPVSITDPGTCKRVITVGAMEECVTRNKNRTKRSFSGCGPTKECIVKPEVVAPGCNIVSCNGKNGYTSKSGTSMATPIVSGVVALCVGCAKMYNSRKGKSGEVKMNDVKFYNNKAGYINSNKEELNKKIKKALFETSFDLDKDKNKQGWGLINPKGMVSEFFSNY